MHCAVCVFFAEEGCPKGPALPPVIISLRILTCDCQASSRQTHATVCAPELQGLVKEEGLTQMEEELEEERLRELTLKGTGLSHRV